MKFRQKTIIIIKKKRKRTTFCFLYKISYLFNQATYCYRM